MNYNTPKVSVVMAVYNDPDYLRPAIDSILQQTFKDFEFIIVDDGSTDNTPNILKSYTDKRLRIIIQANAGPGAAANTGIRASSAQYIARLDADDIAAPNRLETQIEFLDTHPDCVLIGGLMEFITADDKKIFVQDVPLQSEDILRALKAGTCPFIHSSVMFRRDAAIKAGLYNSDIYWGIDPIFYNRLWKAGFTNMVNLPVCMGKYRIVPNALTNQSWAVLKKKGRILRKMANDEKITEKELMYTGNVAKRSLLYSNQKNGIYHLRVGKYFLQHTSDLKSARLHLLQAVKFANFDLQIWYNLTLCYLPSRFRASINRLRGLES